MKGENFVNFNNINLLIVYQSDLAIALNIYYFYFQVIFCD